MDPIIQTIEARHSVEKSIERLAEADSSTIQQLQQQGTIVSESLEGNIITIVLKVERKQLEESLGLAFSLSGVKEVSTDGKTIAVSFISSAK